MNRFWVIIALMLVFTACSKDEESGKVSLSIKGKNETLKSKAVTGLVITDFRLSFRDVEFKKDESDLSGGEFNFSGPYDVDLMDEGGALTQTIGTVEIEDGTYKVLRFKLHKSTDRDVTDVLYDKSVFMAGTINGVPFEFWHDTSENFDFEYVNGIEVVGNTAKVAVQFNMDQFLSSVVAINLSDAVDQDEDGVIEINPDNEDGNSDLADDLKVNIKAAADIIKL